MTKVHTFPHTLTLSDVTFLGVITTDFVTYLVPTAQSTGSEEYL